MIPIGDEPSEGGVPYVNYGLIAANVLAFVLFQGAGAHAALEASVERFSYVPSDPSLFTAFTSMFMHGSWMHLLGNMLFLWIFGDNVEARLGRVGYLAAYLATGLLAGVVHGLSDASSAIPSLGASGAISGVQGIYLIAFPRNRVKLLVFFYYMARIIRVQAMWIMLFWFVMNDVLPTVVARGLTAGGVAHWAHIGGFASGALLCLLMRSAIRAVAPAGSYTGGADGVYGNPGGVWGNTGGPRRWDSGRGVGGTVDVPPVGHLSRAAPTVLAGMSDSERILALWRSGRFSDAAALLAEALRAGASVRIPEPELLRLSGRLYEDARYDDAKLAFRIYLLDNPRGPGAAVASFALGMIASRRDGDGPAARAYLATAAAGHPDPASRELAARELERLRSDRIR